jgi:UDP-N-acetylmuramyl pentapeptide synthase
MMLREAQLVSVDHFRHELLTQLRSAAAQGGTTIVITSGELCKNIRMGSGSTEACCEAMQAEVKPGDDVLVSASRAGTTVRYRLPRTAK